MSAREPLAGLRDDRLDPRRPLEGLHDVFEAHVDTVIGVQRADRAADLGSEHAVERCRSGLDRGDVEPKRPERRGDLRSDEAHPDDHGSGRVRRVGADRVGFLEGAKRVDAGELDARRVQLAVPDAGGDQDLVVADPLPTGENDLAAGGVDPLRRVRPSRIWIVVLGPLIGRLHERLLEGLLAAQVILRKRRAFVRGVLLGADEDELDRRSPCPGALRRPCLR